MSKYSVWILLLLCVSAAALSVAVDFLRHTKAPGETMLPETDYGMAGAAMADYDPAAGPLRIEDGKVIYTEYYPQSVDWYVRSGVYTPEEARKEILFSVLAKEEAIAEGLTVTEAELDDFILAQRENLRFLRAEDGNNGFDAYLRAMGMDEDAYFEAYRPAFERTLYAGKLRQKKYEEYLTRKVAEEAKKRNRNSLSRERSMYSPDINEDFQAYYQQYKEVLVDSFSG